MDTFGQCTVAHKGYVAAAGFSALLDTGLNLELVVPIRHFDTEHGKG